MMNKKAILVSVGLAAVMTAVADDAPLWLRHPAISPDGGSIAFSYRGDLYTVPVSGGEARQLTTYSGYDAYPVWSPDGTQIAFASDREGSLDIFVMPAKGGTARRLTTDSANETPRAWLDNETVAFSASLQPSVKALQGQFLPQTYTVSTRGGRPTMLYSLPMPALDIDSKGRIIYQDKKGFENKFRKHEHSSATSDIWIIDGGRFTCLTDFDGHDLNPIWSGDNLITYLSESDGTLNVWTMTADGKNRMQQTHFANHPVRSLTRAGKSDNGRLAFSWNGEIYTMVPGSEPTKVPVKIVTDDYKFAADRSVRTMGATQMAVAPDGDQVAFVLRGDIYVTSTKYKTTRRITNTAAQERCISFAPDGRSLVYDSDRDGQWKIFVASIVDPKEKSMAYATDIEEKLLYSSEHAAQQPVYSPDGKKIAFLEDRTELRVIDPATGNVNTALDGRFNYSYSDGDVTFVWSPDSRWFLTSYIGVGGWNNTDIALVRADGSEVVDLTESGYTDYNPRWVLGGKALTYSTSKYGMRSHGSWGEQGDVMVMFLDGEAWDKFRQSEEENELDKKNEEESKDKDTADKKKDKKGKKGKKDKEKDKDEVKPLEFDLANRMYRTMRLTGSSSALGDYFLSKDGEKLYYSAVATEGGSNLIERDLKKGSSKILVKGLRGGFESDKKAENLFVITGEGMKKVKLADGAQDAIEFEAEYDRDPAAEREYIYNHMLAQVRDKFYDANLHGVDWNMYGENYRRFLPYINNNYDFADLLSEILGELNASHTGGGYYGPSSKLPTASLGAFFDETYTGDGLRVLEVLPRGPLATKTANVQPGDIILTINGTTITPQTDVNDLLAGKAGKPVKIDIQRDGGKVDLVTVKPVSKGTVNEMLYQRWIERNADIVDSLSNGRLAYVHVKGMDSPSFREVYSRLLGKYRNAEAVIVDTRYNGGGWLHNDIALLLNGKEYVRYTPRGRYIGSDPFSQWTKPSVMLVSEANYSDAHGTPYVYQTLGIGDVIGAPVPGTMTAVWWETQIDPTLYFGIPQVTSLDKSGKPLENKQLTPDVIIYNNPGDVINGKDAQLEGAVINLLDKLDKK